MASNTSGPWPYERMRHTVYVYSSRDHRIDMTKEDRDIAAQAIYDWIAHHGFIPEDIRFYDEYDAINRPYDPYGLLYETRLTADFLTRYVSEDSSWYPRFSDPTRRSYIGETRPRTRVEDLYGV